MPWAVRVTVPPWVFDPDAASVTVCTVGIGAANVGEMSVAALSPSAAVRAMLPFLMER